MIHDQKTARDLLLYLLDHAFLVASDTQLHCSATDTTKMELNLEFVLPVDFDYPEFYTRMAAKPKTNDRFDNLDFD